MLGGVCSQFKVAYQVLVKNLVKIALMRGLMLLTKKDLLKIYSVLKNVSIIWTWQMTHTKKKKRGLFWRTKGYKDGRQLPNDCGIVGMRRRNLWKGGFT